MMICAWCFGSAPEKQKKENEEGEFLVFGSVSREMKLRVYDVGMYAKYRFSDQQKQR